MPAVLRRNRQEIKKPFMANGFGRGVAKKSPLSVPVFREKGAVAPCGYPGGLGCGSEWVLLRWFMMGDSGFRMRTPAAPCGYPGGLGGGFGSSGRGDRGGSSLSVRARTLLIPPLNVETVYAECFPVGRDAFSAERRGAYRPKNLATRSVTAMPIRRRPMMLSPWWPCPELCSHSWNSG